MHPLERAQRFHDGEALDTHLGRSADEVSQRRPQAHNRHARESTLPEIAAAHGRCSIAGEADKECLPVEPLPSDEQRRRLAADLFNAVWTLLEKPSRTAEEDDAMVHAAHASRHHWGEVGTAVNLARGEWQVSRVYATLGRSEPALHHARRCLAYLERAGDAEDWDLPFAYEALARAHALAGDSGESERFERLPRDAAEAIAGREDRDLLLAALATLPGRTPE
jgi:hypothetical protein